MNSPGQGVELHIRKQGRRTIATVVGQSITLSKASKLECLHGSSMKVAANLHCPHGYFEFGWRSDCQSPTSLTNRRRFFTSADFIMDSKSNPHSSFYRQGRSASRVLRILLARTATHAYVDGKVLRPGIGAGSRPRYSDSDLTGSVISARGSHRLTVHAARSFIVKRKTASHAGMSTSARSDELTSS